MINFIKYNFNDKFGDLISLNAKLSQLGYLKLL